MDIIVIYARLKKIAIECPLMFITVITDVMSQDLLGLCCLIETRDHIKVITITAVLFN